MPEKQRRLKNVAVFHFCSIIEVVMCRKCPQQPLFLLRHRPFGGPSKSPPRPFGNKAPARLASPGRLECARAERPGRGRRPQASALRGRDTCWQGGRRRPKGSRPKGPRPKGPPTASDARRCLDTIDTVIATCANKDTSYFIMCSPKLSQIKTRPTLIRVVFLDGSDFPIKNILVTLRKCVKPLKITCFPVWFFLECFKISSYFVK